MNNSNYLLRTLHKLQSACLIAVLVALSFPPFGAAQAADETQCTPNAPLSIVSDDETLVDAHAAAENPSPHPAWTAGASIPEGSWIWSEEPQTGAAVEKTFTRTFTIDGVPSDSQIEIAADNNYEVLVNGTSVGTSPDDSTYDELQTHTIPASALVPGENTLTVIVENAAHPNGPTFDNGTDNPAGVIYRLTVESQECLVTVTMYKHLWDAENMTHEQVPDDSTLDDFPMQASWNASNIGAGSGNYVLGQGHGNAPYQFAAKTADMQAPADYATNEVTGGDIIPAGDACEPGKFRLVGYKTGKTFEEASSADIETTAPSFSDLVTNQHVIVINEECPTEIKVHIYKYLDDGDTQSQVPDDAGIGPFPMASSWQADNINGGTPGSGTYVLGNGQGGASNDYAADTAYMQVPADYATHEVTSNDGDYLPVGGSCEPGKFRLVGYKWGETLEAAEEATISTTAPDFDDLTYHMHVIVVNEECPSSTVFIYKYLWDEDADYNAVQVPDGAGIGPFPMASSWEADNINGGTPGSGTYELGDYQGGATLQYSAQTVAMAPGASYSTHEITTEEDPASIVLPRDAECVPGMYRLRGYRTGETLQAALEDGTASTIPSLTNLDEDHHIIVVNEACGDVSEIIEPTPGKVVTGTTDLVAFYADENGDGNDGVRWAVRSGTSCAAGTGTVFGNVDGHGDLSIWNGEDFSTTIDTTTVPDDEYCFVFNPQEDAGNADQRLTRIFTIDNVEDTDPGTPTSSTVVVREGDLAPDLAAVLSDRTKWFFYNDETDVIDNALGSFVEGPGTAPIGDGSVQMTVSGTERRNIATYQFADIKLADIEALSFSTYAQSVGDGSPGTGRAPYLHFNVDFDNSDTWQRRLVYVPGDNGSVTADTWQNWDAINAGNALWKYSGPTWPGTADPGTSTKTWSQILALYPDAETRSTDSWLGFRVGEPYANGFTGNVDNVVIRIDNGTTDHTTTFDFEPTPVQTFSTSGGGGGDDDDNEGDTAPGEVLGAFTDGAACSALLTGFMGGGYPTTAAEVTRLQAFLNTDLGTSNPVTGFYGPITTGAVHTFQKKYWQDILQPWFSVPNSGIADQNDSTGVVYKTTQWKINMLHCPSLMLPTPQIP